MTNESARSAVPVGRVTWQTQAVLDVMLRAPAEGVWAHQLDREVPRPTLAILRRLERAGWLVSCREPSGAGGPEATWRRVFRFTPEGLVLARQAVTLPVRWPAGVPRERPEMPDPYLETVEYARLLVRYAVVVALDGADPLVEARALPLERSYPGTRAGAAGLALWMLGARPGAGVEPVVRDLFG